MNPARTVYDISALVFVVREGLRLYFQNEDVIQNIVGTKPNTWSEFIRRKLFTSDKTIGEHMKEVLKSLSDPNIINEKIDEFMTLTKSQIVALAIIALFLEGTLNRQRKKSTEDEKQLLLGQMKSLSDNLQNLQKLDLENLQKLDQSRESVRRLAQNVSGQLLTMPQVKTELDAILFELPPTPQPPAPSPPP